LQGSPSHPRGGPTPLNPAVQEQVRRFLTDDNPVLTREKHAELNRLGDETLRISSGQRYGQDGPPDDIVLEE
jgi:hypothetical protein